MHMIYVHVYIYTYIYHMCMKPEHVIAANVTASCVI